MEIEKTNNKYNQHTLGIHPHLALDFPWDHLNYESLKVI